MATLRPNDSQPGRQPVGHASLEVCLLHSRHVALLLLWNSLLTKVVYTLKAFVELRKVERRINNSKALLLSQRVSSCNV